VEGTHEPAAAGQRQVLLAGSHPRDASLSEAPPPFLVWWARRMRPAMDLA
jgi:hypothetical protein